jgi:SAM-dependent methyltransferase
MAALYDVIGQDYRRLRQPDPRIAQVILQALHGATSVLNVGAGTGSYEPRDRVVVAVEPSMVMIRQRPSGAPAVVQATASALPFDDDAFDAAMAVLTVHHWHDWRAGIRELRRVTRQRVVLLTCDPCFDGFWLVNDYFPENREIDRAMLPPLDALCSELGGEVSVQTVEIPHDCRDGFLGAYWRRPHEYLRSDVRAAMSSFRRMNDVESGLMRLRQDLDSGHWYQRYGSLMDCQALDLGYRLLVTRRYSLGTLPV